MQSPHFLAQYFKMRDGKAPDPSYATLCADQLIMRIRSSNTSRRAEECPPANVEELHLALLDQAAGGVALVHNSEPVADEA